MTDTVLAPARLIILSEIHNEKNLLLCVIIVCDRKVFQVPWRVPGKTSQKVVVQTGS